MIKNNNFKNEIKFSILGFMFSLFFTVIPFFLVIKSILSKQTTLVIILICSSIQIILHLKYFLHLSFSSKNYWNIVCLVFSVIVICIIMCGSIWIMYNLNYHMLFN